MQASDADRFMNLLRGMGRVFGSEPDTLVLDAYWIALRDWSLDDFGKACARLLATAKFMPRPSDFNELRNAGKPTSGEAFAKARKIVGMALRSETPSLSSGDPLIDAAVAAAGGYSALAMSTSENIGFIERRFAEHYDAISDREETREALPDLSGPPRHSGGLIACLAKAKRLAST